MIPVLMVLLPFAAAAILAALPDRVWREWGNVAASALGLLLACRLPWVVSAPGGWLAADPAAIQLVVLGSVVGVAGAWFRRFAAPPGALRLYCALFQVVLGATNLAVLADNTVLSWAGLEVGALALAAATVLPVTAESGRAGWRVLMLAGAALVLAAMGTLLLYLAAVPALGPGWDALRWSALMPAAAHCDGAVLSLAFALLLLGYGGLAGLAPLQGWLLEAQAGPVALTGVLGGAVPGVALVLLLRLRGVLDGNAQAIAPGGPLMALGLATLLVSAVGLWRGRGERRWLALFSAGQNGVVAFAFGLGGAAATLAGLVHLTAHTLAKAAAFQGGAGRPNRVVRQFGMAAVAGLPPFGVFGSLVLVMQQTMRHGLWLAVLVGAGAAVSAWAALARIQAIDDGGADGWAASAGGWFCLAGALLLGLAMPAALAGWLQGIAAVAQ